MRAEVTVYGNFPELPTQVFPADPGWTGGVDDKIQALNRAITHLQGVRDQLIGAPAPEIGPGDRRERPEASGEGGPEGPPGGAEAPGEQGPGAAQ